MVKKLKIYLYNILPLSYRPNSPGLWLFGYVCAHFWCLSELLADLPDPHENRVGYEDVQEFADDELHYGFDGLLLDFHCSACNPQSNLVKLNPFKFPVVDHGYRMILMNGFFRNSSQAIRYAAYLVWIQLMVSLFHSMRINAQLFQLFFLITTMSQYVYRFCILCRNGAMPSTIFWSLMFAQVFLNASHACVLVWADYPRPEDAFKMAEMKQYVGAEAGITDINFVSFIRAVRF